MNVHFYATLRRIAGQKTVKFDLSEGTTVQELVEAVVTRFPAMRDELLDEEGKLYPHVHVFVNGRDAPYMDAALETEITRTDKIDIFPAVAGGDGAVEYLSREVRGIPLWLMREYLVEAGGTRDGDGRVIGDGWEVLLTELDDFRIGSLSVGQIRVELSGTPSGMAQILPELEKKLLRAGG
ncbi:MAG: ubiquitin-like small modifier protein 1 [Anaerolineae bacterium]|nr:ubiquitin-like small modifier protein 1 [Anaerolineae bacterium]